MQYQVNSKVYHLNGDALLFVLLCNNTMKF
jgi:hypothetical protein